jgi:hypothetical protein
MTNEMSILAQYQPPTEGPSPEITESATKSFAEFLQNQGTTTSGRVKPTHTRWRRRPLVVAALAGALLAAGGVAIAVIGDGVVYVEPATPITETAGLTLVVQESNIGPCLEVRTEDGMAGGCGIDFAEPLSVGVGSIGQTTFASGWAPPGTTEVELTFENGEALTVTTFEVVEGHDVLFFVVSPVPSPGTEPSLPTRAVAYGDQGHAVATIDYGEANDTDPQHSE